MKLSAAIRRTEATQSNVSNALSFLQTQDGVLKNADKILTRMSELVMLATDVTKSSTDRGLYQTEYDSLELGLTSLASEEFNDTALFVAGGATPLTVYTSEDGSQTIDINRGDLAAIATAVGAIASLGAAAGPAPGDITTLNTNIQTLASMRATNGADQSRMTFAGDMLAINKVNLESANSRIADLDIAKESANLAKLNILQQAGTAMLAQANVSQQSILKLLF
jgi:flagellin